MADAFMFVAGGAVQAGGGIYLERDADRELLQHCLAGDFTYILTSRQMGKSSLMYRAAEQLADSGARPVIIDLTELGAQTTADQWYKGFLLLVQEQLGLRAGASAWWDAHSHYAFAHRLIRYLREVALVERSERLVLFVDEIDTTLRLDFTDDFFAAIRFLYQNRAIDPELERISFVLIGVAMPNDLIKDAARTPFNIGDRIELTDFTRQETTAIASHLAVPADIATLLIDWIFRWTGGHPYLTMRVLRSLVESPPPAWTAAAIDARMQDLFLGTSGESDTNLQFVRDMLTKKAFDREAVLATYQAIRGGARVPDKELDQVASWLKLSGIVRRRDGLLRVRNAIYDHVFDQRWAGVHRRLNVNWRRRLARAAAALLIVIVLVTIPLAIYALRQKAVADGARRNAEVQRDEAERRRDESEKQLLTTQRNLQTAREAVEALKTFDPKAAAQLSTQLAAAGTAAEKELRTLTEEREKLRRERDEALTSVRELSQENAGLKQTQARTAPAAASPPLEPSTVVPDLVGRTLGDADAALRASRLRSDTRTVDGEEARGTIVGFQSPRPGARVPPGSSVFLSVAAAPGAEARVRDSGPAAQSTSDDTLQLVRVLQRYKAGYEALDAKAIAAVYPAANVASLQSALNQFAKLSYDVKLHVDGIVIAADGQTASVTGSETFRYTPKIGSASPQTGTAIFTMRKTAGAWTIQSVKSDTRR
jgi:hypothetical protein